jgi:hypothetical protein
MDGLTRCMITKDLTEVNAEDRKLWWHKNVFGMKDIYCTV